MPNGDVESNCGINGKDRYANGGYVSSSSLMYSLSSVSSMTEINFEFRKFRSSHSVHLTRSFVVSVVFRGSVNVSADEL